MKLSAKTMKKLAALFSCTVLMCAVTSCTREDNPVNLDGSATITLNTQALYEEIGFAESAVKYLGTGYFYLENTLLVYDEAGTLVGKYVENTHDLQPVSFNVSNLPNGYYTIVAVEHGRQQNTSFWELADEENLSTVQVRRSNEHTYWTFALGVASQQITVRSGEVKANLTPKAAGCLFEVNINRTPSFSNFLRVMGSHMPKGLYLNPKLSEDEQLAYDENNTWGGICLIDPSVTSTTFFTIGRGEQDIEIHEYNATENTWSYLWWGRKANLVKEPHAILYHDSSPQLLYKTFVGSVEEYPAWAEAHDTTGLKLDPIMDFGLNVEDFDKIVNSSLWYRGNQNPSLIPWQGRWVKIYSLWPNRFYIACYFETEDGKNAKEINYIYSGNDITVDQMKEEIISWGYEYKGDFIATDGTGYKSSVFLKPNGVDEIQLWLSPDNSEWQVSFHPYDQEDFDLIAAQ